MAIGPRLKWIKSELDEKKYLIIIFILSILISYLILKNLSANFLINTVLIGSAFYLFFITTKDFFSKKHKSISQNLSHFGFSLLILSILFNNIFSREVITNLKVGEKFINEKFQIEFIDIKKYEEQNFISFKGFFLITEQGIKDKFIPELRVYNQPNIITSEADIKTTFWTDKFITMNTLQNEEYFNIRYQVKPFMLWIWISVLIISLGGIISLFSRKSE
jgi:cytochrome c-type biogenesis protein CcmF